MTCFGQWRVSYFTYLKPEPLRGAKFSLSIGRDSHLFFFFFPPPPGEVLSPAPAKEAERQNLFIRPWKISDPYQTLNFLLIVLIKADFEFSDLGPDGTPQSSRVINRQSLFAGNRPSTEIARCSRVSSLITARHDSLWVRIRARVRASIHSWKHYI